MQIKHTMRMMVALCAVFALTVGVATATAGGDPQKKLCSKGGWQMVYGPGEGVKFIITFTSQRDCVSYVTNGGTLLMRFGSLIDCENLGGTYTTVDQYWRCNGVYYPDQAHSTAGNQLLYADCVGEGAGGVAGYYASGTIGGTTDAWCSALYP